MASALDSCSPYEERKVWVGNLNWSVESGHLKTALSQHAKVISAFIVCDKVTRRSRKFGFVTLGTQEDVEKLLKLDLILRGQKIVIKRANKLGQPNQLFRHPLPDRPYDLMPADPTVASIHILVTDVLIQIFDYLDIYNLIKLERVCLRFQALVYLKFSSIIRLDMRIPEAVPKMTIFSNYIPLNCNSVHKLLLLCGENLKELKLKYFYGWPKSNTINLTGSLCPNLEHLDISSMDGVDFKTIGEFSKTCNNLKCFIAAGCRDLKDKTLEALLNNATGLEHLDISYTTITGTCFSSLPSTLKTLKFKCCMKMQSKKVSKSVVTSIATKCPNLQNLVIDMDGMDNAQWKLLSEKCPLIQTLDVSACIGGGAAFDDFKYLTSLTINQHVTNLLKLTDVKKNILHLDVNLLIEEDVPSSVGGFEAFSALQQITFSRIPSELMESIAACPNLTSVTYCGKRRDFLFCVLKLLKNCPKLEVINCLKVSYIDIDFVQKVNEAVQHRTNVVKLNMKRDFFIQLTDNTFNESKISVTFTTYSRDDDEDDDDDDDDSEDFSDWDDDSDWEDGDPMLNDVLECFGGLDGDIEYLGGPYIMFEDNFIKLSDDEEWF